MEKIFLIALIIITVLLPSCLNITNNYYGDELDNSTIEFGTKSDETKKAEAKQDETEDSVSEAEIDGSQPASADKTGSPTTDETETKEEADANQAPSVSLRISALTTPISVNNTATVEAFGKPNTEYDISVIYSTAPSSAKGLENKMSDENGTVSWSWKIGPSVKTGRYKITVTGGGETVEAEIHVN